MPLKGWHPPDVRPFDHEELAVTNAGAVPLAGPQGALQRFDFAWIEIEGGPVRMWYDGTAPTTTVGHFWIPGQSDILTFLEVAQLLVIATTAVAATVRATYYRLQ